MIAIVNSCWNPQEKHFDLLVTANGLFSARNSQRCCTVDSVFLKKALKVTQITHNIRFLNYLFTWKMFENLRTEKIAVALNHEIRFWVLTGSNIFLSRQRNLSLGIQPLLTFLYFANVFRHFSFNPRKYEISRVWNMCELFLDNRADLKLLTLFTLLYDVEKQVVSFHLPSQFLSIRHNWIVKEAVKYCGVKLPWFWSVIQAAFLFVFFSVHRKCVGFRECLMR